MVGADGGQVGEQAGEGRGRQGAESARGGVEFDREQWPDVMLEFEVGYVTSSGDQRLLGHLEDALKDLERAVGI